MPRPTYITINVRLTEEQAQAVEAIATARGSSQASVIRWFVTDGIDRFFMPVRPTDEAVDPTMETAEAA